MKVPVSDTLLRGATKEARISRKGPTQSCANKQNQKRKKNGNGIAVRGMKSTSLGINARGKL